MQQYKYSDALLWRSMPEGADIVRAFFSEDRERRIFVYRRKDGTYSYTDQALTFDEYEQEYWWRGTDNYVSFYESEESVLADTETRTFFMQEYQGTSDTTGATVELAHDEEDWESNIQSMFHLW